MNNKRILIISHNPINDFDNMGRTIGNIFSDFPDNSIGQLFFIKQDIKSQNCSNFFNIDDISILKSIIARNKQTGIKINQKEYSFKDQTAIEKSSFRYGKKKTALTYFARNIMWKWGKWNTKELKKWLKENHFNCIFYFAGDYTFSMDIALKLSKELKVPLYIYFSDEYYRYIKGSNLLENFYKFFYRRKFKEMMRACSKYFCISDEMEKYYKEIFQKQGIVIMNSSKLQMLPDKTKTENLVMSYIGNLEYDRWRSILKIGNVIEDINKRESKKIELNIYSGEEDDEIINKLKEHKFINYKGYIKPELIEGTIQNSDILLHTEDFNPINIGKVKYSISTKIPDSLASGRILLIYAPQEIACTKYVKENDVGVVAHNNVELENKLIDILNDKIDIASIIKNANSLVEKRHRSQNIYKILKTIGE